MFQLLNYNKNYNKNIMYKFFMQKKIFYTNSNKKKLLSQKLKNDKEWNLFFNNICSIFIKKIKF